MDGGTGARREFSLLLQVALVLGLGSGFAAATGCHRNPIGPGGTGGPGGPGGGDNDGAATTGDGATTTAGGTADAGPRIGTDGICGSDICPQGQQCCLSSGKCVAPNRAAQDCPPVTPRPAICAGVTCAAGQVCCVLNGQCIDLASAATTCPKPQPPDAGSSTEPPPSQRTACGSNADCRDTEFCVPSHQSICLGPGYCTSRSNCGGSAGTSVCRCDGVTYPDVQSACRVNVHTIGFAACGTSSPQAGRPGDPPRDPVIFCGTNDQCPAGQGCCAITGRCYDVTIPVLCSTPPPGTDLPCVEDRQCPPETFCMGPGCSGPGGCTGPSACTGELAPVCGCNGKSYTNAGCAGMASVRVAHAGMCETPGDGGS